jgi:hypothetical protein
MLIVTSSRLRATSLSALLPDDLGPFVRSKIEATVEVFAFSPPLQQMEALMVQLGYEGVSCFGPE